MGRVKNDWQDRDYVLSWFGEREGGARRDYWKYVEEGVGQGRRPELVGGGVVRSYGGWSAVLSLRKVRERISGDRRILGVGDFVERVLRETEEPTRHRFSPVGRSKRVEGILREECRRGEIELEELRMGGRRGEIPRVRSEIVQRLVKEIGMSLAEVARWVGVSTSAISKILQRSITKNKE
jgi:hypothetical protein